LTPATLDVHCFGERAGTLAAADAGMWFEYDRAWIADGRPPLSQALPLDGGYSPDAVRAFFTGLLPEGEPRELLARDLGLSARNEFAMLAAVGEDCAGAVSVYQPGTGARAGAYGEDVDWLDDRGLAKLIDELPRRPMLADPDGEFRLSLAGAQDKLPVVVDADGRVGVTSGRTPSTHILKTPIARLDGTVVNEAFCLRLARAVGVDAVNAEPRRAHERECLLVERYDRERSETGVMRLHQEDFCQALGLPPERKYEAEGGPSLADCFALVSRAADVPARDAPRLLDVVGFNFLVGNHDAHGKNFSLLYRPSRVDLAPFYDLLSTAAYRKTHRLSRRMAMKIGGEGRPEWVRDRHLARLFEAARLGAAPARRRLMDLATRTRDAAGDVRAAMAAEGWDEPVLERILEVVPDRARLLEEALIPPAGAARARG
jgi:serine/threonine-protein kinase HipA